MESPRPRRPRYAPAPPEPNVAAVQTLDLVEFIKMLHDCPTVANLSVRFVLARTSIGLQRVSVVKKVTAVHWTRIFVL